MFEKMKFLKFVCLVLLICNKLVSTEESVTKGSVVSESKTKNVEKTCEALGLKAFDATTFSPETFFSVLMSNSDYVKMMKGLETQLTVQIGGSVVTTCGVIWKLQNHWKDKISSTKSENDEKDIISDLKGCDVKGWWESDIVMKSYGQFMMRHLLVKSGKLCMGSKFDHDAPLMYSTNELQVNPRKMLKKLCKKGEGNNGCKESANNYSRLTINLDFIELMFISFLSDKTLADKDKIFSDHKKILSKLRDSVNAKEFDISKIIDPCTMYKDIKTYWNTDIGDVSNYISNMTTLKETMKSYCFLKRETIRDKSDVNSKVIAVNEFDFDWKTMPKELYIAFKCKYIALSQAVIMAKEGGDYSCEILQANSLDCFYMLTKLTEPDINKKYATQGSYNPCSGERCDVIIKKEVLKTEPCEHSSYDEIKSYESEGAHNTMIGSQDTCYLKQKYSRHYLCFDSHCSVEFIESFDKLRIKAQSNGPKQLIISINGVQEEIKTYEAGESIKHLILKKDVKLKLFVRCNQNDYSKFFFRNYKTYCKEFSTHFTFGSFLGYAYCYYSKTITYLIISLGLFFGYYVLNEILIIIFASLTTALCHPVYVCFARCFRCPLCYKFGCSRHVCTDCSVCGEMLREVDFETGLHICQGVYKPPEVMSVSANYKSCMVYFYNVHFIACRIYMMIIFIVMCNIVIKSAGAEAVLDLHKLKAEGFTEFASRINTKDMVRETLAIKSETEEGDKKLIQVLMKMRLVPGFASGYKIKKELFDESLDVRIDQTYRTSIIRYQYTTCMADSMFYQTSFCSGTCNDTCNTKLKEEIEKDFPGQPFSKRCQDAVGGWQCGCFRHGYGSACAACHPKFLESDCAKVYEILKNVFSINLCFHFSDRSFCKTITESEKVTGKLSAIYVMPNIKLKQVNDKIVFKNGVIYSGPVNALNEFGNKFGNLQRVDPDKKISFIDSMITTFRCDFGRPAAYTLDKCFNNLYKLLPTLKIRWDQKKISSTSLETKSEDIGFADVLLTIPFKKISVINVDGSISSFKIIEIKGCYNCFEGAYVTFEIKTLNEGLFMISCKPDLSRDKVYVTTNEKLYKIALFSDEKKLTITCKTLNLKSTFKIDLDDPVVRIIDLSERIINHEILIKPKCSGFACIKDFFLNLNVGSLSSIIMNWFWMILSAIATVFVLYILIKILIQFIMNRQFYSEKIQEFRKYKNSSKKDKVLPVFIPAKKSNKGR